MTTTLVRQASRDAQSFGPRQGQPAGRERHAVLARLRANELRNLSLDHLDVVKFNFVLESGCQFERGPDFTLTTPSITPFILPDRGS